MAKTLYDWLHTAAYQRGRGFHLDRAQRVGRSQQTPAVLACSTVTSTACMALTQDCKATLYIDPVSNATFICKETTDDH